MNVFSFCLYNPYNGLYYDGLLENIALIHTHFPGWGIFVYIGNDVPSSFVNTLVARGVQIRYTNDVGPINMIHRFLAIEEPGVDIMIVRDADSRVHWKDRWAIREFVKSPYLAHTIRDNPVHLIPMLGGLWGLKRSAGIPVYSCFQHYKENQVTLEMGKDQTFLNMYIWYRVRHSLLVHTSIAYNSGNDILVSFPFPWTNDIYCGRIEPLGYVEPPMPEPEVRVVPKQTSSKLFTNILYKV
jgi:hypothetical protein